MSPCLGRQHPVSHARFVKMNMKARTPSLFNRYDFSNVCSVVYQTYTIPQCISNHNTLVRSLDNITKETA
jgi:hypothetical protein